MYCHRMSETKYLTTLWTLKNFTTLEIGEMFFRLVNVQFLCSLVKSKKGGKFCGPSVRPIPLLTETCSHSYESRRVSRLWWHHEDLCPNKYSNCLAIPSVMCMTKIGAQIIFNFERKPLNRQRNPQAFYIVTHCKKDTNGSQSKIGSY